MSQPQYIHKNLSDIPHEDAHGGSGQRQIIFSAQEVDTPYFEVMTKGF